MVRFLLLLLACGVLPVTGSLLVAPLHAGEQTAAILEARKQLAAAYPAVRWRDSEDGSALVYGTRMGDHATAAEAAERWLTNHGATLGIPAERLSLIETRRTELRDGRFTVFAYRQEVAGIRIQDTRARILVRHDFHTGRCAVVLVSAQLVTPGVVPAPEPAIGAAEAQAVAEGLPGHRVLAQWRPPERVLLGVEQSDGTRVAVDAWRLWGHRRDAVAVKSAICFVDARTGRVLEVRDAIHHVDEVSGTVTGLATPGLLPDVDYNEPEELVIPNPNLTFDGDTVTGDEDGEFVICTDADDEVTVEVDLLGEWVQCFDDETGDTLVVEGTITPPGTLDFLLNDPADPVTTDLLNGYIHVNTAHDFISERSPDLDAIDESVDFIANFVFACAAFFDPFGNALVFGTSAEDSPFPLPPGLECAKLAYSTIIVHEYGHFVLEQLDLPQDAFGEGYSDALAAMVFNDPVSGADAFGEDTEGRNLETSDQSYPCSDPDPHVCGLLLAGVWWDLKLNMEDEEGEEDGLEMTRQLFVDWTATTVGTTSDNTADEDIAIEILTLDDDDGDIDNGTPHSDQICAAFEDHGVDCPEFEEEKKDDAPLFLRGDVDGSGAISGIPDALFLLEWFFEEDDAPPCMDAADVDDGGTVAAIPDALFLLRWFFGADDAVVPPDPGPDECGPDPEDEPDELDCETPAKICL